MLLHEVELQQIVYCSANNHVFALSKYFLRVLSSGSLREQKHLIINSFIREISR